MRTIPPTYPYKRVVNFNSFDGVQNMLRLVVDYLADMPAGGYAPPDDNAYPRVRLWKYLYYDDGQPLLHPLPTAEQKLSVMYDPERAETPPSEKGWRFLGQRYITQSQLEMQTFLRVRMGRVIPRSSFQADISLVFDMMTSMRYETNLSERALSRTYAMEQCIIEALNGVNIDGVGTVYFDRVNHGDCGSVSITDERANLGRKLTMGISYAQDAHEITVGRSINEIEIGF